MRRKLFLALFATVLALSWPTFTAQAHAIDSTNIDQYARLEIGPQTIRLHYILNMGNLPAYLEHRAIDTSVNAELSAEEQEAYLNKKIPELLAGMTLTVNGAPVELRLVNKDLSFPFIEVPDVDGGLMTMLLILDFEAPLAEMTGATGFEYRNNNFPDGPGWREIVVRPQTGFTLNDADLAKDLSNELRGYPPDMKSNLLDRRSVSFTVTPGGAAQPAATPELSTASQPVLSQQPTDDKFASLIAAPDLTPEVIFFSLLLALVLGASHALTPGHGKTIVGAYLVGNRGHVRHAIFLGLTTTITHTIGVFILGFVTMLASNYILPKQLFPWLEFTSGALVVVLGLIMLRQRLANLLRYGKPGPHRHDPADLDHHHDHDAHDHADHDHDAHSHSHLPSGADDQPVTWRSLLALGISGGLLPCPSALVVMLGAIALQRVAFGMLLIVAFSLGLAGVLTGIGLLLVYARQLFDRLPTDGRLIRGVSVASAGVVTLAGVAISVGALYQI